VRNIILIILSVVVALSFREAYGAKLSPEERFRNAIYATACKNLEGAKSEAVDEYLKLAPSKLLRLCSKVRWFPIPAISATVRTAPSPKGFRANMSLDRIPFSIQDPTKAKEAGKALEDYNLWYATEGEFGLRVGNYTGSAVRHLVLGYKNEDCRNDKLSEDFDQLMLITASGNLRSGMDWLLKWERPVSLKVSKMACMVVLGAFDD